MTKAQMVAWLILEGWEVAGTGGGVIGIRKPGVKAIAVAFNKDRTYVSECDWFAPEIINCEKRATKIELSLLVHAAEHGADH